MYRAFRIVLVQPKIAKLISQLHILQRYLFILYTPTCFDISISSSGRFIVVSCQGT